ncbi:MAG: hypothetical protein JOY82_01815 [Streptosporangiaceae bacterium]|nr:hypothetical protein [Streptosporangiaceae bacterium]
MELSTAQQRAIFVVVVACLAGLGLYLVGPLHHSHGASPPRSAPPSQAAVPSAAANASSAAPSASSSAGSANIYGWLPFTQQDLADAAQVTTAFCAAYEDYTYTESGAAYASRLSGLATSSLTQALKNAYLTPGVAQARTAQKQVSTGSGTIDSLRAFGAHSLTFVVTLGQRLLSTQGAATHSTQYAITVVSGAGGWQVNDIELASQGNF